MIKFPAKDLNAKDLSPKDLNAKDLSVKALTVTGRLDTADLDLPHNRLSVILGPNGAGKSTLLKAMLGVIKADSGSVTFGKTSIFSLSPQMRAQHISYLPQIRPIAWPNIVHDIVALGRYAHNINLSRPSPKDRAAIDTALRDCDLLELADRRVDSLSGGELARMHCARAFAANTPFLIADEPVAALDPKHQFRIMNLIQDYIRQGGTALIVLHDIQLAAQYADHLIWMKSGKILAQGRVEDSLNAAHLAQIYGIKADYDGQMVSLKGVLD